MVSSVHLLVGPSVRHCRSNGLASTEVQWLNAPSVASTGGASERCSGPRQRVLVTFQVGKEAHVPISLRGYTLVAVVSASACWAER